MVVPRLKEVGSAGDEGDSTGNSIGTKLNGVVVGRLMAPWGSLLDSRCPVKHRDPYGPFESEVILVAYADPVSMSVPKDLPDDMVRG